MTEVRVPTLGESVTEATVATWFKKPGDAVAQDEMICELETDKVTVEVAAPVTGILSEIVVPEGTTIGVDALLAQISEGVVTPLKVSNSEISEVALKTEPVAQETLKNAPAAEKLMADNNITNVTGTGRDGRIMKGDVLNAITDSMPELNTGPARAARKPDTREERVTMTRLRQTIARRLKESQNTAAMLTTYNEVDMTAVMDLRNEYKDLFLKKHGVKLGFMSFFTLAVVRALKMYPDVNSMIDGDFKIEHDLQDISIAVSGPKGLMVPVIRNAEKLSFKGVESEVKRLAIRARDGQITIDEMTGGTFTITNGGVFGSMLSTPIINPPQSAILGMHNIVNRPMAVAGEVVIQPIMYVALSYDHRIIDGRESVGFLVAIKEALENPVALLMDSNPTKSLEM
jgi:2-oxoglutarate dehydrogenase E2 component (dihydrolipoamide succinyltransferase)